MPVTQKDIEAMKKVRHRMEKDMARAKKFQDPDTEKGIMDRIHDLEYRRIMFNRINHPQVPMIQDNITEEIKRLYSKLETLQKMKEAKPNAPNA